MLEIQHNTIDWDYSKTQTLVETWKTQNRSRGEFGVSLEVDYSFPQVGRVRNKLQSHTVPLNLKLLLQMQVCAWMVHPLSISGIWLLKYYILH